MSMPKQCPILDCQISINGLVILTGGLIISELYTLHVIDAICRASSSITPTLPNMAILSGECGCLICTIVIMDIVQCVLSALR